MVRLLIACLIGAGAYHSAGAQPGLPDPRPDDACLYVSRMPCVEAVPSAFETSRSAQYLRLSLPAPSKRGGVVDEAAAEERDVQRLQRRMAHLRRYRAGQAVSRTAPGGEAMRANEADSLALVALYNAMDGPSWNDRAGWLEDPVADWAGVGVDANGRVVDIDLSENGLFGMLPAELFTLSELRSLNLSTNFVLGSLPVEVGNLTNLTVLDLSANAISGEMPASLGDLSSLTQLILWQNLLTGAIPPELGALSNLQELWLFENELTGAIPDELRFLSQLQLLFLDFNQLEGPIPAWLVQLTNLQELFLDFNRLSGPIPPELGAMTNLLSLFLGNNDLEGSLPPQLANLSNLLLLSVSNAGLEGTVPAEYSALAALRTLDVSRNALTGPFPPAILQLFNMTRLFLHENQFSGPVPGELAINLFNLVELDLSVNAFDGPLPPAIGVLGGLDFLNVGSNNLSGPIPSLNLAQDLRFLLLNDNQFSGVIGDQFRELVLMQNLDLSTNNLTGEVPRYISTFITLQRLSLGQNDFSGSIPPSLGTLDRLVILDLWNNDFSGAVPAELGGLQSLELFDAGSNALSGMLPPSLGQIGTLRFLLVDNNALAGPVPDSFRDLAALQGATFQSNGFTAMPDFSGLAELDTLDISLNNLTFESIEPNLNAAQGRVSYAPQLPLPVRIDELNGALRYAVDVGGTANTYQWFRNGVPIDGATGPVFQEPVIEPASSDTLTLQASSFIVTDLVLNSVPVRTDARLESIILSPTLAMLASGDTLQFSVAGRDQFGMDRRFTPVWSATGGVIDEDGLYVAGDTSGTYRVAASDLSGALMGTALVNIEGIVNPVATESPEASSVALHANYPNPFAGSTRLRFELVQPERVSLRVFDVLGRELARVVDGVVRAGVHDVVVDSEGWPAGIYWYTLQAGPYRETRSMVKM